MNVLAFVEQQHGAQVADAFVSVSGRGDQFEALELAEVGRVAEHVDVEEFGDVAAPPSAVLGAERVAYLRALLVDHFAFLGSGPRRPDLTYEVPQALRRRRELDAKLVECAHYLLLDKLLHYLDYSILIFNEFLILLCFQFVLKPAFVNLFFFFLVTNK